MRKVLGEFYTPSEDDFKRLWKEAIFVFDANVLLDVHRYSPETRDQLLAVLERLKERVWVPYQAAFEYQNNYHNVTWNVLRPYDLAVAELDKLTKFLSEGLRKFAGSDVLLKEFSDAISTAKESLQRAKVKHAELAPHADLHEKVTTLLDGKVGEPFSKAEHEEKSKEAERRIAGSIPPGFKDKDKPDKGVGDVLLWFQMLSHAKAKGKPMVFISGDAKEDWWWQDHGRTIGPRPELRREMKDVSGVEFYMYPTERFLEHAREYLDVKVTEAAIQEARAVQNEGREPRKVWAHDSAILRAILGAEMPNDARRQSMEEFVRAIIENSPLPPDTLEKRLEKYVRQSADLSTSGSLEERLADYSYNATRAGKDGKVILDHKGKYTSVSEIALPIDGVSTPILLFRRTGEPDVLVHKFPRNWREVPGDTLRLLLEE